MKLFTVAQVIKYFTVLDRMSREVCERYSDENERLCGKQVFVRRTLRKWFSGKYVILYTTSEHLNIEYKRYINIGGISYRLGWGNEINVNIIDYAKPVNIFDSLIIGHNEALDLEGEWITDPENHHYILLKMTNLSIPEREFVFKAYDVTKLSEQKNKREDIVTTVSFHAMTEKGAYRKKKDFENNHPDIWVVPEIVEIKDVKV